MRLCHLEPQVIWNNQKLVQQHNHVIGSRPPGNSVRSGTVVLSLCPEMRCNAYSKHPIAVYSAETATILPKMSTKLHNLLRENSARELFNYKSSDSLTL